MSSDILDRSKPLTAAGIVWLYDPKIRKQISCGGRDARRPHDVGSNTPRIYKPNISGISCLLEEIDTPILNSIPNDIVSTNDIDNAIGALTNHITTVIESSSRTVPAKSDRRELPRDVIELIRDKNAALCRAGKYPTCEKRVPCAHSPT
ncbi:hypothetical protein EVAR_3011_1 [Eumeta japonica]|uniref:Uncharacterized protein n=1 Tax=Eumeta variegata TaxID=151549 RepID=A0A4C1STJ5_EUMVA|nr:hypothetical protein EVAR_3011_1 [Eumeta japonica]